MHPYMNDVDQELIVDALNVVPRES